MLGYFPPELQERYQQGKLIPFIGAGVSASVEWVENGMTKRGPTWGEMVEEAARKLGFEDPSLLRVRGTDLQILEYFKLVHNNQFSKLTNWLYAEMQPPDDSLKNSPIHQKLACMDRCHLIYTTNYDDFIERSLTLHGRKCIAVAVEADMGRGPYGATPTCEVVKFHGDFNYPDYMVISESHYEERLALSTAMDYRLNADILGRVLLFLGYSFQDPNVSYLFRLVNDRFKLSPASGTGRRAYIAVAEPSDFEIRLFRARNIEVIPISSKTRVEDIVQLLNYIMES